MLLLVSLTLASSLNDVQNALASGRCSEAAEAADDWVKTAPSDATAWRSVGDSARCTGNTPAALGAYRKSLELRPEPGLQALVDSLGADYANVTLVVTGADAEAPPAFTVQDLGRSVLTTGSSLNDLTANTKLVVEVSGKGYEAAALPFSTGGPGTTTEVPITVTFLGRGTVTLTGVAEGVDIRIDGEVVEGDTASLVAGSHKLVVKGSTGERHVDLEVARDEEQPIDVSGLLPAAVTLLGIPERTTLTFAGPGDLAPLTTAADEGELDAELGIHIAPLQLTGLAAGEWTYTFEHPLVGTTEGKFFAVGGQVSAEPVAWRELAGVAPLATAYTQYQASSGQGLGRDGWMTAGGAAAGLAGLGLGTARLLLALEARSDARDADARYKILVEDGDIATANLAYAQAGDLRQSARTGLVVGSSATVVGVAGAGVAVVVGKRWLSTREVTRWEPFE